MGFGRISSDSLSDEEEKEYFQVGTVLVNTVIKSRRGYSKSELSDVRKNLDLRGLKNLRERLLGGEGEKCYMPGISEDSPLRFLDWEIYREFRPTSKFFRNLRGGTYFPNLEMEATAKGYISRDNFMKHLGSGLEDFLRVGNVGAIERREDVVRDGSNFALYSDNGLLLADMNTYLQMDSFGHLGIVLNEAWSSESGKGYFSKLFTELVRYAHGLGATHISLEVDRNNLHARDIYDGFGFREVGTTEHNSDNTDRALMRLELA